MFYSVWSLSLSDFLQSLSSVKVSDCACWADIHDVSLTVCLLEHFQVIFMSRCVLTLLALVAVGKKTLLSWSFWLWMLSYLGISCLWCHWWFDYLSSLRQFSWADVYSHWLHLLLMIKRLSSLRTPQFQILVGEVSQVFSSDDHWIAVQW